jgi:large subunit ribosomal protein MRP49
MELRNCLQRSQNYTCASPTASRVDTAEPSTPSSFGRLLGEGFANKSARYRKFWRVILPRLKFRNPSVPMTVYREQNPAMEAMLSIYFASKTPGSTTPASIDASQETTSSDGNPGQKVINIDMKNKTHEQIWEEVRKATNAMEIPPSPEELQVQEEIKQYKADFQEYAEKWRQYNAAKKRDEMLLKQARGELD